MFVDFSGELRRLPLLEDRRSSESLARLVDQLNSIRSTNETVYPSEIERAIPNLPAGVRDRLGRWDILRTSKLASTKPLSLHLADFKAALIARGNTEHHAETTAT